MKIIMVILLLFIIAVVAHNRVLKLEMIKFSNNYGIKADRRCCFASTIDNDERCERKCLTFFKFCLKTTTNDDDSTCLSEFETQIIGENTIERDNFNQTTNLIEFPLQQSNQLILIIDIFNDKSVQLTHERELISKWILNLNGSSSSSSSGLFDYKNKYLNQQLVFEYKFVCSKGYTGVNCQNAICLEGCDNGYCDKPNECLCREGWSGRYCDNKYLCLNGGTSTSTNECICAPGYTGERCQIKTNKCGQIYCLNNSTCVLNNENRLMCQCKPFFTGLKCETSVNLCLTNKSPCQHKNCLWNKNEGTFKCVEQQQQQQQEENNNSQKIIIILTLGITLPILILLIVLLIIRIYKNFNQEKILKIKNNQFYNSSTIENIYIDPNNIFKNKNNNDDVCVVNTLDNSFIYASIV